MKNSSDSIPNATIETLARTFYKETIRYGFRQVDYLRFVNYLLDMSLKNGVESFELDKPIASYVEEKNDLPLEGDQVIVRAFVEDTDRTVVERWVANDGGKEFLLSRISSQPLAMDLMFKNEKNLFGIILLKTMPVIPIGIVAFLDYDQIQRQAELRKLIGEPHDRGQGYAKEATKLWMKYGIATLGLKKIYLTTLETNLRNIRMNEELGFQVESIQQNVLLCDGKYYDILKMSYSAE
ncbi:MAG: GNAT family N-acetyltransferase [candidate division KSB1 bacterium]|nr:GNAT family N-acetyltransferase [candidate division KSB1 bacterium]MDZ7319187.1 GNAT family N-acetyltransferase [candidate division KSB1 bacterium]MDZ7342128.1 GNAT family N-acetyltransferase [candidate division KSB1 bacterium]